MLLTYSIIVSGKVQGVFYRQSAKEKANSLGITGTVKNEDDGNVLIIATGSKGQLEELVAWCHRGPAKARVEAVEVKELLLQQFSNFTIARD